MSSGPCSLWHFQGSLLPCPFQLLVAPDIPWPEAASLQFLPPPHIVIVSVCPCLWPFFSYHKGTSHIGLGLILMQYDLTLITSAKTSSPNEVSFRGSGGWGLQHMFLWGTLQSVTPTLLGPGTTWKTGRKVLVSWGKALHLHLPRPPSKFSR